MSVTCKGRMSSRSALRLNLRRVGAFGVVAAVLSVLIGCSAGPMRVEPVSIVQTASDVDSNLEVASAYAPIVFQAAHPEYWRQDVPAPFDFDGDKIGQNNWENFPHYEIAPTLYYSVLETDTHWFITYHMFHARDWSAFNPGIHLSHENDGENLQVVVSKRTRRPQFLVTQAHFVSVAFAGDECPLSGGCLKQGMIVANADGEIESTGDHVCVFVECCGHGIHGAPDSVGMKFDDEGAPVFAGRGMVLVPQKNPGQRELDEPREASAQRVPYRLVSLRETLWPSLVSGDCVGDGRLLDGAVRYRDGLVDVMVPRYYDADRFSGPFGPDRGISPFALDFTFCAGKVGALFFNPARRYQQLFEITGEWSLDYIDYPFVEVLHRTAR